LAKSLERDTQFQEEMMRISQRWTGLRTSVLALAFVTWGASGAWANAIIKYTTSGQIDPSAGVTGANVVSFIPINGTGEKASNTITSIGTPSNLSLGDFQVAGLPDGQTTTYKNTPFSITFLPNTVNGDAYKPDSNMAIVIHGVLNGLVQGASTSSLVATFDHIDNPAFKAGKSSNTLSIADELKFRHLVPSTDHNGESSAEVNIASVASPIPEPTSIALFLTTLAGLGVHRLRTGRRLVA